METTVGKSEVSGVLQVPCSKSYAQRTLAAALLAAGETLVENLEMCDDTRHALDVISDLGADIRPGGTHEYRISGGFAPRTDVINIGESGLATRMFTPIAALGDSRITITGSGSILRRPMDMMIAPLRTLGVDVESNGFLPLSVRGPLRGGTAKVDGSISSQFITGLLMALPKAQDDTTLHIKNPASIPYLDMTLNVARQFNVRIEHANYREFYIRGGQEYLSGRHRIEGDWSSAAFMLVAGAVAGKITVANMNPLSLQADLAIVDVLTRAGAGIATTRDDVTVVQRELRAFEFDASNCPDLFPVLAVLAANCEGVSKVTGAKRLIHKESNRALAIVEEYSRLGINVSIKGDVMTVKGGPIKGGVIDSRNDHRIAMAGAVAALTASKPVTITGAESVAKSYPGFWEDLDSVTDRKVLIRN